MKRLSQLQQIKKRVLLGRAPHQIRFLFLYILLLVAPYIISLLITFTFFIHSIISKRIYSSFILSISPILPSFHFSFSPPSILPPSFLLFLLHSSFPLSLDSFPFHFSFPFVLSSSIPPSIDLCFIISPHSIPYPPLLTYSLKHVPNYSLIHVSLVIILLPFNA